eukprot:3484444-Amphidinium_carterae.1
MQLPRPDAILRVRTALHGSAPASVRSLIVRVQRTWAKSDRWCARAVGAIRLVARAAGPACSAAYAKLLVGQMQSIPLRCGAGARLCPWCGVRHFTDSIQNILSMGCYRPALRPIRAYSWLTGASPQVWLELTQTAAESSTARHLGL